MTKTTAIVPGSLSAVAARDNVSLAETFLNCEVVVLIDQSGSMNARDVSGRSRYDAADDELARLQREHPGEVAVISFSSWPAFCPGGVPDRAGLGTDIAAALKFARVADGVCQVVLISDGEPDSEQKALAEARRYRNPIHTIYIGPERGDGRAFLERLAAATGGRTFVRGEATLLADSVSQLLLTAYS